MKDHIVSDTLIDTAWKALVQLMGEEGDAWSPCEPGVFLARLATAKSKATTAQLESFHLSNDGMLYEIACVDPAVDPANAWKAWAQDLAFVPGELFTSDGTKA